MIACLAILIRRTFGRYTCTLAVGDLTFLTGRTSRVFRTGNAFRIRRRGVFTLLALGTSRIVGTREFGTVAFAVGQRTVGTFHFARSVVARFARFALTLQRIPAVALCTFWFFSRTVTNTGSVCDGIARTTAFFPASQGLHEHVLASYSCPAEHDDVPEQTQPPLPSATFAPEQPHFSPAPHFSHSPSLPHLLPSGHEEAVHLQIASCPLTVHSGFDPVQVEDEQTGTQLPALHFCPFEQSVLWRQVEKSVCFDPVGFAPCLPEDESPSLTLRAITKECASSSAEVDAFASGIPPPPSKAKVHSKVKSVFIVAPFPQVTSLSNYYNNTKLRKNYRKNAFFL